MHTTVFSPNSKKTGICRSLLATLFLTVTLGGLSGCASLPKETVPVAKQGEAPAIIFDIDGTLTTKPISVFTTRDEAVTAVQTFADAGYEIIYLSARHPYFQWLIPGWLEKNGFPEGALHVPQSRAEHNAPARFKASILKQYVENNWTLIAAFGDTTTDFEAYQAAGIPRQRIYALQRYGAQACQSTVKQWNRCLRGWKEQLGSILSDLNADDASLSGGE